jgi:hypothetical protein
MNKDKLQAEILAKIKEGIKPSDLKKTKPRTKPKKEPKPSKSPNLSLYVNKPKDDRRLSDFDKSDNGYESSSSDIPTALPLPNSQIKDLQTQITTLKKQLKVYKDFKEADLKIKEDLKKSLWALNKDQEGYKQEIADLNLVLKSLNNKIAEYKETIKDLTVKLQNQAQTIEAMEKQTKTKENIKQEPKEPQETKTFLCSECKQTKPQSELSRVFDSFSFCLNCSKKARQTAKQKQKPNPEPQPFTCVVCDEPKQAVPIYKKVDISYKTHLVKGQAYPVCASCSTYVKEYNEHENQEFSIGED